MPITPRKNIAASVAALRQIDARNRTDRAITEVAETFHLAPETVAQIAAEESHEAALFENRRHDANSCRDCGACASNCGRRELIAA